MKRIAILGATSQIAKDLIRSVARAASYELILYARHAPALQAWLAAAGLAGRFPVRAYASYGDEEHDAVINFVGVGDPSRAAELGAKIFDITLEFDQLVLDQLQRNPQRRYVFLSSGAAYGSTFLQPASAATQSCISLNALTPQEYYAVAKLHAECRHRAASALSIVDLRVFNYFSRTQDMGARFFITDVLRAIQAGTLLRPSPDHMVRDFLHPDDFYQIVHCVLQAPPQNTALDCYTSAPVEKHALLAAMAEQFGLRFEIDPAFATACNATGAKPCYYSLNRQAAQWGYQPAYSALDCVLVESAAVLGINASGKCPV